MRWEKEQIKLMGTVIDLLIGHKNEEELLPDIVNKLKEYEQRFSANDNRSELMIINRQAGQQAVKVDSNLFDLIKLGKANSLPKNSFLNIAIGPLTQAWHIGFKDEKIPSQDDIDHLLRVINPEKIKLNEAEKSVYLESGMSIDLGALAKGFIADLLMAELKEKQVLSGLINLGGNVLTFGTPQNAEKKHWLIGIKNPRINQDNYEAVLKIKNKSVVTSGVYERVLKKKNKTYHHIFSSETGYPVSTEILSLTIISDKSVDGEIWTTRLFGEKPETIIEILNTIENIEGLVITETKTYKTNGMNHYL